MKWIVRAHEKRRAFVEELVRELPAETIVLMDDGRLGARGNFLAALDAVDSEPAVYMEDDIILTRGFTAQAQAVIGVRPHSFIQFFSRMKADLTVGSRWQPGGSFSMCQCHYIPAEHSVPIADFFFNGGWKDRDKHTAAVDLWLGAYLQARKMRYWLHCPSLVEHRVCRSVIDPRRSSRRQSKTFVP